MTWLLFFEIVYLIATLFVCLRIIYDTQNTTKTLAYLLLTIFLPVLGAAIYFSLGINYRKRKLYSKKLVDNEEIVHRLRERIQQVSTENWQRAAPELADNYKLTQLLINDHVKSPVTASNKVTLLTNGEEKFPAVFRALEAAENSIHIEYYIYEDDVIGNQLKDALIQKAKAGVKVRFIFDDFGARPVRKKILAELHEAGVEAYPFHEIIFWALANRLNYRNHRKIIIIDGKIAFTGGINVCDKYINTGQSEKMFWRDTHVKIEGNGVFYLQYMFLCDWKFCSGQNLVHDHSLFPKAKIAPGNQLVQIAGSGPDSPDPTILYVMLQMIQLAKKEIFITTPYFIPGESLLQALIIASLSGVDVKIIVPGISDSYFVNAAAHSYYTELLEAGVEIYFYQKGFVHAKTIVTDTHLSTVGTANMDQRSFDLNFEVNTLIYDVDFASQLRTLFLNDLKDCNRIDATSWMQRPWYKKLFEKVARLLSPLL